MRPGRKTGPFICPLTRIPTGGRDCSRRSRTYRPPFLHPVKRRHSPAGPYYLIGGAEGVEEPPRFVIDCEGQALVLPPCCWSFMSLSTFIRRTSSSTGTCAP